MPATISSKFIRTKSVGPFLFFDRFMIPPDVDEHRKIDVALKHLIPGTRDVLAVRQRTRTGVTRVQNGRTDRKRGGKPANANISEEASPLIRASF